jgi:hypothetical protein
MKIPHIDPNSAFGKILLSCIDKLIIGILAGVIVLFIQIQAQKQQQLKDESFSVARVQTDILIEQRGVLVKAMTDYIRFVGSGKVYIDGKFRSTEDQVKASQLQDDIRLTIFTMGAIDDTLSQEGKELVEAISILNSKLLSQKNSPQQIDEGMEVIRGKYRDFIVTIKTVTREILQQEFQESRE